MSLFGRRSVTVARLLVAGALAATAAGCGGKKPTGDEPLPPNKFAAMNRGDQLINDGQDMKAAGMKTRAAGGNGDDMIKKGEEKIAQGERMKADAAMMKP